MQAANISEAVQSGLHNLESDPTLAHPCEDTDVRPPAALAALSSAIHSCLESHEARTAAESADSTHLTSHCRAQERCGTWAAAGECDANPGFMKQNCRISCNTCARKAPPAGKVQALALMGMC